MLACRFAFVVSLNVTGAAHYVVMPANASLPTVVDSQMLTTQAAGTVFPGNAIAASGDMSISSPFTNYSQVVLVSPESLELFLWFHPLLHASCFVIHSVQPQCSADEYCIVARGLHTHAADGAFAGFTECSQLHRVCRWAR